MNEENYSKRNPFMDDPPPGPNEEKQPVKNTKTPWALRGHNGKGRFIFGLGAGQIEIGEVYADGPRGEANAEFIVRAVNSHQALLVTAKNILELKKKGQGWFTADWDALERAIGFAEGKEVVS